MSMSHEPDERSLRANETVAASGRSGPSAALILVAILAAIIVIFILRNSDKTEIDFMFFNWHTTVRWSIFVSVVLGVLLDRIVTIWWRRRGKRKNEKNS